MKTVPLGGFNIVAARGDDVIALLRRRRDERCATELLFANANFILQCHRLADQLNGPGTLILNDGIGVDLASLMFHRRFFAENLAGTDFLPRFLATLDRPTRLFLLGARPASIAARTPCRSSSPSARSSTSSRGRCRARRGSSGACGSNGCIGSRTSRGGC